MTQIRIEVQLPSGRTNPVQYFISEFPNCCGYLMAQGFYGFPSVEHGQDFIDNFPSMAEAVVQSFIGQRKSIVMADRVWPASSALFQIYLHTKKKYGQHWHILPAAQLNPVHSDETAVSILVFNPRPNKNITEEEFMKKAVNVSTLSKVTNYLKGLLSA